MKMMLLTFILSSSVSAFGATYNVNSSSQLSSALAKARGGDVINLAGGNYGALSLSASSYAQRYAKYSGEVIVQAAGSTQPIFSNITLRAVTNLTLRNIKVVSSSTVNDLVILQSVSGVKLDGCDLFGKLSSGYGTAKGLKIAGSKNVQILNTLVTGFRTGMQAYNTDGLILRFNEFNNISYDVMQLNLDYNVLIDNNNLRKRSPPGGDSHQDVIQFTNDGGSLPAANIVISNNILEADDSNSHGIYFGNANARINPVRSNFYKNIRIVNNKVYTAHLLGIAIGHVEGLTIEGNDVQQHSSVSRTTKVSYPVILVESKSTGVVIRSNITTEQPTAADSNSNWIVKPKPSSWNISSNTIVNRR